MGHEVEVLTGFPNYPGGKLYPGYKVRLFQREVMNGIPVLRVPLYPSHDRSPFRRILNYVSFAVAALLGVFTLKKPDVVYVYTPPPTAALPALALRMLCGIPYVLDIQDLWPDTLTSTGMMSNRYILKIVNRWLVVIYRHAAGIAVLSKGFKVALEARGAASQKVRIIPNWTTELPSTQHSQPAVKDEFNVVFAGNMGPAQALGTVIEAARILVERAPEVRFTLVGTGIEAEELQASSSDLHNVKFLPRRPPTEMGEIFEMADALLVHLLDDPLFAITIPSKTQAYLAAGKPILMGVRGDAAQMVEDAGAGVAFTPENPQALCDALLYLMKLLPEERTKMGENGRAYYQVNLAFDVGVRAFADFLRSAAIQQKN
jgi:glycosyltransferase involved in cell wall biosynthesis